MSRRRAAGAKAESRLPLSVSVTDGRGRPLKDGGLARWLMRVAPATARGELAIALVTDARMRILNRSYRRKDYPTDVLSFDGNGQTLGDVVIAKGVAARQARQAGHPLQAELRVLALHGLLHLLGYDHEAPDDRGRMARMESRLRRKGGLAAGLIDRARAATGRLKPAATARGAMGRRKPAATARGRRRQVEAGFSRPKR